MEGLEKQEQVIKMSREDYDLIRNNFGQYEGEEQKKADELMKKYGLKSTSGIDDSVKIDVDGELVEMGTWEKDWGTEIEKK